MTLIAVTGFFVMLILAVAEAVVIYRLTKDQPEEEISQPAFDIKSANEEVVDMLCASLLERSDAWTFDKGAMTHKSGLEIIAQPNGDGVVFKRSGITSIVGGSDAERIKAAVFARNLKQAFVGL